VIQAKFITMSVYIPRISVECNEEYVKYVFAFYCIGTVSHVDFTSMNKKPGFRENEVDGYRSAFVHFSHITKTELHPAFWESIFSEKSYKLNLNPYGMDHPKNPYWICLKNKNPVKRTMMNIHQVVDNARYLEDLIEEQAKTIKQLKDEIEQLKDEMVGVRNVVHQLIGGLFSSEDQKVIQQIHLDTLFRHRETEYPYTQSKWNIQPTTAQGDYCERKMEDMEVRINELTRLIGMQIPNTVTFPHGHTTVL